MRLMPDGLTNHCNLLRAVAGLEQPVAGGSAAGVGDAAALVAGPAGGGVATRVRGLDPADGRAAGASGGMALPPVRTLEEVRMTLVERVAEYRHPNDPHRPSAADRAGL